jgi:hypothetical protein
VNSTILNQTWIQTLISTLFGGAIVVAVTHLFNTAGHIRVLLNSVEIDYYRMTKTGRKVKFNIDAVSLDYSFFVCRLDLDLFNESMQTKVIRDIRYEFYAWDKPYIYILRRDPVYLKPRASYKVRADIHFEKSYHNFFIEKRHFVSYLNPRDRRIRIDVSSLTHFVQQENDVFFTAGTRETQQKGASGL